MQQQPSTNTDRSTVGMRLLLLAGAALVLVGIFLSTTSSGSSSLSDTYVVITPSELKGQHIVNVEQSSCANPTMEVSESSSDEATETFVDPVEELTEAPEPWVWDDPRLHDENNEGTW